MAKIIKIDEIKAKLDAEENFYLIDARAGQDFEHNHLPEAISLPWGPDFEKSLPHVLPDKDSEIIVYGTNESCVLAKGAADFLEKAGYARVGLLGGGIMEWMEAGHALEFGRAS